MTGRWWRSTPRMAPSAGVSPLPPREGVFLRTRPLVTERSVIVTTEKPGLDEPANTFAVDRRNGRSAGNANNPVTSATTRSQRADGSTFRSFGTSPSTESGGTLVALAN